MRALFWSLSVLILYSCNTVRINYDYDTQTDFSNYTTYNYYPDMQSGLSQLDEKRLLNALDTEMQAKGIRYSVEPDFYINIESSAFQTANNTSVGLGIGGSGRNLGGGVSIGIPVGNDNQQRQIRFDFVDSQKDVLFWNATAEASIKDNLSPEGREERLKNMVTKVFSKYPPKLNSIINYHNSLLLKQCSLPSKFLSISTGWDYITLTHTHIRLSILTLF